MKWFKWAFIVWSVSASLLILLALISSKNSKTETHIFCAYNRIFVEFEESGKRWGTIMLDYEGKPIPCSEDEQEVEKISSKGLVI